jgi:hypothetical protein
VPTKRRFGTTNIWRSIRIGAERERKSKIRIMKRIKSRRKRKIRKPASFSFS